MDVLTFSEPNHPLNPYIRFGTQGAIAISFPMVLIALANIFAWIVNNPLLFVAIWMIALTLGMLSDAIIEFDYHFGFPLGIEFQNRTVYAPTQPQAEVQIVEEITPSSTTIIAAATDPENEQSQTDVDIVEPVPANFPLEMGLAGQGENHGDLVPPNPDTSSRSRPQTRKQRTSFGRHATPEVKAALDGANIPPSPMDESASETDDEDKSVSSFKARSLDATASNSEQTLEVSDENKN